MEGKELLSQKQRGGNNIYVTREAQVEDLTRKPTRGAMVMSYSSLKYNSSGVLQKPHQTLINLAGSATFSPV